MGKGRIHTHEKNPAIPAKMKQKVYLFPPFPAFFSKNRYFSSFSSQWQPCSFAGSVFINRRKLFTTMSNKMVSFTLNILPDVKCSECLKTETKEKLSLKRKGNNMSPAKPNAPVSLTSPERLKLAPQSYRLDN